MAALCVVWVALSIPAAVVMADMFLGRGAVDPQALGGLIGALISLYEECTCPRVRTRPR